MPAGVLHLVPILALATGAFGEGPVLKKETASLVISGEVEAVFARESNLFTHDIMWICI